MKHPKYRYGDIVYLWSGDKARVLRSYGKDGVVKYQVELLADGKKRDFLEIDISFNNRMEATKKSSDNFIPPSPLCPKCKNLWAITSFGRSKWHDCPTCKDTAENICSTHSINWNQYKF